jgi:hypothetical protein
VAFADQPVLEEFSLGGFAGAVGTFEGDQKTAIFSFLLNRLTQLFRTLARAVRHLYPSNIFGATILIR